MKKKVVLGILAIGIMAMLIIIMRKSSVNVIQSKKSDADIVISDNSFIQETNDIYLNTDDYVDKSVNMEGYIYVYSDDNGVDRYAVVRNTPGCCGSDGLAGLDIYSDFGYPEAGAWVEITGAIKKDTINGMDCPIIYLTDMVEKEEGKKFVTN